MTEPGAGTFARLLRSKVAAGVIHKSDSVLVQFAGTYDEAVCQSAGLTNCTFANIAPGSASTGRTKAQKFDAHRMPDENRTFDHVIAHSGLHHCSRPHEALHEMYRLARKTILFVENQDSVAMRIAKRLGFVGAFELPAVIGSDYQSGGVDGTPVPNYVYRWTRTDLRKAVASFDPAYSVPIEIYTEWNMGLNRASSATLRRKLKLSSDQQAAGLLTSTQRVLNRVARGQGNIFAATIRKDLAVLQPWMSSPNTMTRTHPLSGRDS